MARKTSHAGLRKHRPKKPFRFEYIKGKFSCLTKKERVARRWDEWEDFWNELRADLFVEQLEDHLKAEKKAE